jgi:hypothetical protein
LRRTLVRFVILIITCKTHYYYRQSFIVLFQNAAPAGLENNIIYVLPKYHSYGTLRHCTFGNYAPNDDTCTMLNKDLNLEVSDTTGGGSSNTDDYIIINPIFKELL